MAFPDTALDVTVELAIGADIHADPASWSWTDVTTSIRERQKVTISRGRRGRVGQFVPTRITATADNTNGNLCRHNPSGAYFGTLKKNTPIRVSVNNGGGDVVRGAAFVTGFPPSWDPSENNQTVTLTAVGLSDRLGRGRVLRSPLYRTMAGVAEDDYQPHVYWPMEDGTDSTQFASGMPNGTPASPTGSVSFAAYSALPGSGSLPTFAAGAQVLASIPAYTDTDQWVTQFVINVPSAPASAALIGEWRTPGGTVDTWRLYLEPGSPDALYVRAYNSSGTEVYNISTGVDSGDLGGEDDFYGHTFMLSVANYQTGSNNQTWLKGKRVDGLNIENATTITAATAAALLGSARLVSPVDDTVFGHWAFYTDPNFDIIFAGSAADINAAAMDGYVGEMAHERAERLCREERVRFTTAATTSQAMGVQTTKTLLELLRECATADSGLLYDNLDFGLTFVSAAERYNLTAAITLAYGSGHILPPWEPDDDNQDFYNDVTASRPDGSSYRAADEDSIDDVGTYGTTVPANTETDSQLSNVAGWYRHLGETDELTWPDVRPHLQLGGSLLNSWLATDLGEQLHVTGHPSPLAPDTIRQVVEGYTETMGAFTYTASAVLSPASVWDVAELDDDDSAKLDTDGSDLTAAVSSSATSLSVATQTGTSPLWPTDAGEMPIPLTIGGEVMSATAIAAPTTITFGAAGTAAHASNASVTPGIPASVAAGNLLLVLAAIRNSGTGVPNTPSGYTRLPVFASTDNVQLFAKVATSSGEVAPTITFTGGVANADTSAQMCRIAGAFSTPDEAFVIANTQLNASAQDIGYPCLALTRPQLNTTIDNAIVFYLGWKQDDWTSVATVAGAAEIGEPDTTTGDDQGIVWDYVIQTTATDIVPGSFTVTGGAAAISRGAVVAIRSNIQAVTVTRSINGVAKSHSASDAVNVHKPARLAL